MVAMTVLPISLIPTFLVPLFPVIHIVCVAQARKWAADSKAERQMVSTLQHSPN